MIVIVSAWPNWKMSFTLLLKSLGTYIWSSTNRRHHIIHYFWKTVWTLLVLFLFVRSSCWTWPSSFLHRVLFQRSSLWDASWTKIRIVLCCTRWLFYLTVFSICEYIVCSQPPFLPFVLPHVYNWQVVELLIVDLKQFNKGGEDFHMNRFGFYFVLRIFALVFHGTVAVYMRALVSVSIPSLPLFFRRACANTLCCGCRSYRRLIAPGPDRTFCRSILFTPTSAK